MRWPMTVIRASAVRIAAGSLVLLMLIQACSDAEGVLTATVSGSVVKSVSADPIAAAIVSAGNRSTTTGADGRFVLSGVPLGTLTLRCSATGFDPFEVGIQVTRSGVVRDIALSPRVEVFEFGDFAVFVPATVDAVGGVLVALGGPDTRGFATGKSLGAPNIVVEAALDSLGQSLREMAAQYGLAILGSSVAPMPNGAESDQLLAGALQFVADSSKRADLPGAPMLLYGLSGGGPQAAGFTARHPDRVAGLFLKVPAGVETLTSGSALAVPTFVALAGLDEFIDTAAVSAAFEANRAAGALWALGKEPGVPHHFLSKVQRKLTLDWMRTILDERLDAGTLADIPETSGWLGDRASGVAWSWDTYPGDRAHASWLPSQETAEDWEALIAGGP